MIPGCLFCGAAGDAVFPGAPCHACLGRFAQSEVARVFVGEYEKLEWLGEGATGVVHRGEHRTSGEVVAIKLAKPDFLALPAGAKWFLRQARTESLLRHPHIVGVYGTGTFEGRPFLVMPWMAGGTLVDAVARFPTIDQRLSILVKVARAVQFAHERGVLHCDLKPENILFDSAGEPHVSDFGMARAIDESLNDGFYGGSVGYMSPEQARRASLTTASDVFALGAILYFLVTNEPAFGSDTDPRTAQLGPLPPYRPALAWGALAIAHRALASRPERRYSSAAAFAEEIERLLANRPIRGQRVPWFGRLWCWTERHPGARNAMFLLLPCFAALAFAAGGAQHEELRQAVLDMNAHSASGQAAAVLYQLRDYGTVLERAATDLHVRALTQPALVPVDDTSCPARDKLSDPAPLLPHSAGFETVVLFDGNGCPRSRVSKDSPSAKFIQRRVDWRWYLGGSDEATLASRGIWVRRAYRSSVSGWIKFAVSTPIFAQNSEVGAPQALGLITGTMTVASTLELPRVRRIERSDRFTGVIGPFEEGDEHRGLKTPEFAFLVHPRLGRGQKATLDEELGRKLHRHFLRTIDPNKQFDLNAVVPFTLRDYRDPWFGESWLAAFAPVGGTNYLVVVQSRDDVATRPALWVWRLGLLLLGSWMLVVCSWGGFALWSRASSRRMVIR